MTALIKTVKDIKNILSSSERPIGLLPTMGALHAGHISLIKACKGDCKTTVLYIFVNPLQFGPDEDYEKYPRDLQSDLKICEENNIDYVFAPAKEEIYPENDVEIISPPESLAGDLCGRTRKNFFSGVVTVVKRFFDIIQPDYAYFGEKDLQQLFVIRWLVKEFKLPIFIRACSIIREPAGLAFSSRNQYLTKEQRIIACNLYQSLKLAKQNIRIGIFPVDKAVLESLIYLSQFSNIKVEYFEARDKENLAKVKNDKTNGFYFLVAAWVGGVRLIDNIEV